MKKTILILMMFIASFSSYAQVKSGINTFYSSTNSFGIDVISATTTNTKSVLIGFGTSWHKNNTVQVASLTASTGYDFGQFRLVSRMGIATDRQFVYGGYAGVNATRHFVFNVGYDNVNKYTTGITFMLN
jgi:hypothetical protein